MRSVSLREHLHSTGDPGPAAARKDPFVCVKTVRLKSYPVTSRYHKIKLDGDPNFLSVENADSPLLTGSFTLFKTRSRIRA
jgi:hypothetical protein